MLQARRNKSWDYTPDEGHIKKNKSNDAKNESHTYYARTIAHSHFKDLVVRYKFTRNPSYNQTDDNLRLLRWGLSHIAPFSLPVYILIVMKL